MIKTKTSGRSGRKWTSRAYRTCLLATCAGGFISSAHAVEDISFPLALTCSNSWDGKTRLDSDLDQFRGQKFPSPKTGGFTVESVRQEWWTPGLAPYCLIKGTIQPTSPDRKDPHVKPEHYRVPDINYQVYIPSKWNGKFIQLGGGAFAWSSDVIVNSLVPSLQFSTSLANYAVVISDAGVSDGLKAFYPDFVQAGNSISDIPKQEMVKNFGSDSIKKSLDVGLAVVTTLTGKRPSATYFVGISTGGRQALKAMANWPDAYDGVVAGAPPVDETNLLKALQVPELKDQVAGLSVLGESVFKIIYGEEVSKEFMRFGLQGVSWPLQGAGSGSGESYDAYNKVLDSLAPVWNVKPGDLSRFFKAANQKSNGGKGKKIILYQGTSDFLVPCTQAGGFVSGLSKNMAADKIKNSVRTYFIKGYSHGFFTGSSVPETGDALKALRLDWDAVSELDQWVHDDSAKAGAPRLARNPSGEIPSDRDLTDWKCLAAQ